MKLKKDPHDLFTADPSKMSNSQKAEYIYLLQRYLTEGPSSDHIRQRIGELDWTRENKEMMS